MAALHEMHTALRDNMLHIPTLRVAHQSSRPRIYTNITPRTVMGKRRTSCNLNLVFLLYIRPAGRARTQKSTNKTQHLVLLRTSVKVMATSRNTSLAELEVLSPVQISIRSTPHSNVPHTFLTLKRLDTRYLFCSCLVFSLYLQPISSFFDLYLCFVITPEISCSLQISPAH